MGRRPGLHRTAEQQKEYNRQRREANRRKKEALLDTLPTAHLEVPSAEPPETDDQETALTVEMKLDEAPPAQLSLKERLFGAGRATTPQIAPQAKKRTPRKQSTNLISSALPTVIASFIATYSRHLLPDLYKPCAPSMDECNAFLAPLLAIIGRRIEITGKASQDVIDATNCIISAIALGTRAWITYISIKSDQASRHATTDSRSAPGTHQTASAGAAGIGGIGNGSGPAERTVSADNGIPDYPSSDPASAASDAAIVANLFRRDIQGRVRLGLLQPSLQ